MLKRDITYEDFDGNTVTETFYFNLTKTEIVTYVSEYGDPEKLQDILQAIIDANDMNQIIAEVKKLILLAYGIKSEDGKRFIKSDQLREEFSQTAAFDSLFMELATSEDATAIFTKGIIPSDIDIEIPKTEIVQLPPAPPTI